MKVSLNFEFDSNESAETFLRTVRERAAVIAGPVQTGAPKVAEDVKSSPEKRKGRVTKAKAEAVIAPGSVGGPVETRAEQNSPAKTLTDAQKALEDVFAAKGLPTARNLLSRYGVQRLANLPPEKYGEFVEHAGRVLAGGEV